MMAVQQVCPLQINRRCSGPEDSGARRPNTSGSGGVELAGLRGLWVSIRDAGRALLEGFLLEQPGRGRTLERPVSTDGPKSD